MANLNTILMTVIREMNEDTWRAAIKEAYENRGRCREDGGDEYRDACNQFAVLYEAFPCGYPGESKESEFY